MQATAQPKRVRAKLSREQAGAIKREARHWRLEVLALRYGVALSTVKDILSGKTWKTA